MASDEPPPIARVWARRRPINYPKQVEISGGIAAPLLAGFSLTAVAQLVIGNNHPRLAQWSIAAFAISAVLFIYAVQLSALAVGLAATPADRLDYSPEAATQPDVLRAIRLRQWKETKLRALYSSRAGTCYNSGMIAFLAGLGFLLVPYHLHPWPWGRLIGILVVVIALSIETLWAVTHGRRPQWLLPADVDAVPDPLGDEGRAYLFPDRTDAPAASSGRNLLGDPLATQAPTGIREWRRSDVLFLLIALVIGFALVSMAALAIPPLSGIRLLWVLGIVATLGANTALGTLAVGAYIEMRHKTWSRLHGMDYLVMGSSLTGLGVADGVFTWWLFSSTGSWTRWAFLGLTTLAVIGGGIWSRLQLWPRRTGAEPPNSRWEPFSALSALLGAGLGVVVAVILLAGSAISVNSQIPTALPIPIVHGITGRYLAIGDSYSAGEGLTPFLPVTVRTNCDRSESQAYSERLSFATPSVRKSFTACSGAIVRDVLHAALRNGIAVPPQVANTAQPGVGLVTITMGGNDALFSKIVIACFEEANCLRAKFPPNGVASVEKVPPGPLASTWGPATVLAIGGEYATLFPALRRDFPNARILVIGYPYLFPSGSAPFWPLDCFSVLRRFSEPVRNGIRQLQAQFNDRTYEEAVAAHIEFVSPVAIWTGHEPCGNQGQYTNSIKPYLSFTSPIDGGTFHPNGAGQDTLARLVACYLNAHPKRPDPFTTPIARAVFSVPPDHLATPSELGLVDSPGSTTSAGC